MRRKLLLLGIQTGDKLAKPPVFVAYSQLCLHCRNLAKEGYLLSRFQLTLSRHFLGHVICRNLRWKGLINKPISKASIINLEAMSLIKCHYLASMTNATFMRIV